MLTRYRSVALVLAILFFHVLAPLRATPPQSQRGFAWPAGHRSALSLTFDDGRPSQLDEGVPVLGDLGLRATFYVVPDRVRERAGDWRKAAARGHEIGSHSLTHPCTGNFPWSRARALEDYSLDRMRQELVDANVALEQVLGITARTFAYPCGQTFVGRGVATRSYVPVVSELFLAGRGWMDEAPNDPAFVDLAQVLGVPMDDVELAALRPMLEAAEASGAWLVLAGHDIGAGPGRQVTRTTFLHDLAAWLNTPGRRIWVDTVEHVAAHVARTRTP